MYSEIISIKILVNWSIDIEYKAEISINSPKILQKVMSYRDKLWKK